MGFGEGACLFPEGARGRRGRVASGRGRGAGLRLFKRGPALRLRPARPCLAPRPLSRCAPRRRSSLWTAGLQFGAVLQEYARSRKGRPVSMLRIPPSCRIEPTLPVANSPRPKRRVTNWADYNEALRQWGSLTVWFTDDAIAAWKAALRMTLGGQPHYSDLAITTALTLRAVFHLPLRQTEGLIGSILQLLGIDLPGSELLHPQPAGPDAGLAGTMLHHGRGNLPAGGQFRIEAKRGGRVAD